MNWLLVASSFTSVQNMDICVTITKFTYRVACFCHEDFNVTWTLMSRLTESATLKSVTVLLVLHRYDF